MIARIAFFALIASTAGAFADTYETFETRTLEVQTDSETLRFEVEIADEPDERSQGLMFRETLDDGTGMLFIYPEPLIASFWMRNTRISLDMLFIDADGKIVNIARKTRPYSLTPVTSEGLVDRILEISGGDSDALGIAVGDTVKLVETPSEK